MVMNLDQDSVNQLIPLNNPVETKMNILGELMNKRPGFHGQPNGLVDYSIQEESKSGYYDKKAWDLNQLVMSSEEASDIVVTEDQLLRQGAQPDGLLPLAKTQKLDPSLIPADRPKDIYVEQEDG